MDSTGLEGIGVALPTPFDKNKEVDYVALEKITNYVIDEGVDFLVVLGTTAESPTLSRTEKTAICECVKNTNAGRLPLVIGIGSNDTAHLERRILSTDLSGFSAILSVTPYYNKPSQEGLFRHFKFISDISPLPIILYNVPSRTGVNMSAATTLRLAEECENILGTKEASGDIRQIEEIIHKRPTRFKVFSGDDSLNRKIISAGAQGAISVAANAFPSIIKSIFKACSERQYQKAKELDDMMKDFYRLLFIDGNPAGIKCALSQMSLLYNELRLPLTPVSGPAEELIRNFISSGLPND